MIEKRLYGRKEFIDFLFQDGINLCNLGQSPHQVIFNLYNIIALTEIKGYAMIQVCSLFALIHFKH